ncbi:unnamed protein product [Cuscuta campestris]|uniref:Uncharacterized protein n=1 Tax=Cuscuta campestris TaxID=132261 RepID=A0A484N822_9ASTE|nr:unnamed protein product [Cuscuta campestris]
MFDSMLDFVMFAMYCFDNILFSCFWIIYVIHYVLSLVLYYFVNVFQFKIEAYASKRLKAYALRHEMKTPQNRNTPFRTLKVFTLNDN